MTIYQYVTLNIEEAMYIGNGLIKNGSKNVFIVRDDDTSDGFTPYLIHYDYEGDES